MGFYRFFSYINFILGYVPLLISDLVSQLTLLVYTLYMLLTQVVYKTLNIINTNLLNSIESKYMRVISNSNPKLVNSNKLNLLNLFQMSRNDSSSLPLWTKKLYNVQESTKLLNKSSIDFADSKINYLSLNFYTNIFLSKNFFKTKNTKCISVTLDESFYSADNLKNNFQNRNLKISLTTLNKIYNLSNYPLFFNFNIDSNLKISKQQRWLARNSLLTESIISNSFLTTQAKKLIGLNTLNSSYTNKTLWLPTKTSKLSSLESSLYFNTLNNQHFNINTNLSFIKGLNLSHGNFKNLNFFENSRFWLMKKYFYNTNQHSNILVNNYKILHNNNVISLTSLEVLKRNLNQYTNNMLFFYIDFLTPSLNSHKTPKLMDNSFNQQALVKESLSLQTPNLDILTSLNTQFIFNTTVNKTNHYYNYIPLLNKDFSNKSNQQIKFLLK